MPERTPTIQLLDRYKEHHGLESDYAAARALGVTPQAVAKWRRGGAMDETTALQIADELGIPPMPVLAEVRLSRATTERERRVWQRHCARVLLAGVVAATLAGEPGKIYAAELAQAFNLTLHSAHYAAAILIVLAAIFLPCRSLKGGASSVLLRL